MNKAFTANINDQVTARGYLDENDQLIMLEPEMSAFGAVKTITATINASLSNTIELDYLSPEGTEGLKPLAPELYAVYFVYNTSNSVEIVSFENVYLLVFDGIVKDTSGNVIEPLSESTYNIGTLPNEVVIDAAV